MTAESYRTSFYSLNDDRVFSDDLAIAQIEIPLFQRDYAQGRESDPVRRIRTDFLDVLRVAIVGNHTESVGLDFVYGGVEGGTLQPLDGQQRLTTLFLLHWYMASRSGHLDEDHSWKRFSYATRQSARMFCQSLGEHALPDDTSPSEWITDQPWYLFLWRHDPTIQSMLVVLDAIDDRFRDVDAAAAWARLTDAETPAIWFLLLPLSGLGADSGGVMRPEDLYIKMNSRGKPLTEFENFKAHFEQTIQWSPRRAEFSRKVDTCWSDLLWHVRGDDGLIDDEFLRYLEFITEICEWHDGRTDGAGQRLGPRTQAAFGKESPQREEHLDFLFRALDVWVGHSIPELLGNLFADTDETEAGTSRVKLFSRRGGNSDEDLNLFESCCRWYGETRGQTRAFPLGQSLVLYAVLLHLIEGTPAFPRRIRILRNLVEASADELRPDRMPRIIEDVHRIIRDGVIEETVTLNQAQADDERRKLAFLASNPEVQAVVFALEDHELLRGSLGAFELDANALEARAAAFRHVMSQPGVWTDLLGALLAVGEYQRQRTNSRPFLFGTDSKRHDGAWRELLTGPRREALQQTRQVLSEFLDRVGAVEPDAAADAMNNIIDEYLVRCETERRFDWRYYMVKYPNMRADGASTYFAEPDEDTGQTVMGYSLCMLKPGRKSLSSYYRDPYLLTIHRELDDPGMLMDKWFSGYETEARRLPLARSGASIRCIPIGFELSPPPLSEDVPRFTAACIDLGADENNIIAVPQIEVDGRRIDTVDRIQVGVSIIRQLANAGL
ncbi:MAG: DUF262 domain-containing protein [Coriobacteriia bacterium]|nr:DUF262 domain-containing protein [Coriobacteriia bacterium]